MFFQIDGKCASSYLCALQWFNAMGEGSPASSESLAHIIIIIIIKELMEKNVCSISWKSTIGYCTQHMVR